MAHEIHRPCASTYRLMGNHGKTDTIVSRVFPELAMQAATIFDFPIDPGEELKIVREAHPPYGAGG